MKQIPTHHRALLDAEDRLYSQLKGRLINHRRNELGKSQQEVADDAAISRTEMHNIEHGLSNEGILVQRRVCRALCMSHGALIIELEYLMVHPEVQRLVKPLISGRGKKWVRSLQ
jgi:DNA-binding XRE family transcriptional regulator